MKRFFILFAFLWCVSASCKSQDCDDLPEEFPSYSEAIEAVEEAAFLYTDKLPSGKSSWIKAANYYSCDGATGYLIYKTDKGRQYIHANVPKRIWREFKEAESSGSYYDYNIKNKYKLPLE